MNFYEFLGLFSDSPGRISGLFWDSSGLKFRDCFPTFRTGISEFFSGSPGLC